MSFAFIYLLFRWFSQHITHIERHSLRENCFYSEFFWSLFCRIRTRKTPNRDTFHAVIIFHEGLNIEENSVILESDIISVDPMNLHTPVAKVPRTYHDLPKEFISLIPKGYIRVDIIMGNYENYHSSIKRDE